MAYNLESTMMKSRVERELELATMEQTEEGRTLVLTLYRQAKASPRSRQRHVMLATILDSEYPKPPKRRTSHEAVVPDLDPALSEERWRDDGGAAYRESATRASSSSTPTARS